MKKMQPRRLNKASQSAVHRGYNKRAQDYDDDDYNRSGSRERSLSKNRFQPTINAYISKELAAPGQEHDILKV